MAAPQLTKEYVARWSGLLMFLGIFLGAGASTAFGDELTVRDDLKTEAAHLLEEGNLAAYDERATELRRTRARTPAGIWKLSLFYRGPDNWPAPKPEAPIWTHIEAQTEAYLQAHPDSSSAVIAHARLLVSHAWVYRGSGLGRDLSDSQRENFATYLEHAREVLDQHREVGIRDPEWYALRIRVMNGQNIDKATIFALTREALDHEPTYQPIDYAAATAFLPKWGGSAELLQQFVALAIAKSSVVEGTQAYGRIMFDIARGNASPITTLAQVGVQWPLLKASLEQTSAAYPDPWNLNTERAMACLIGTQTDYNASLPRVNPAFVSVAWFDSLTSWPECQRRQELAKPTSVAGWAHAFVSTPPSVDFFESLAAGALVTLALLYFSRRPRDGELLVQDQFGGSISSGGEYPRNYSVSLGWKIGIVVLAGILLLGCFAAAWEVGVIAVETRNAPQGWILVFLAATIATGAAFYIVDTLTSVIVLLADLLEIHELWRVRRILRTNIEGRQVLHPPNSPAVLVLTLKAPSKRKIKLPVMWTTDSTWTAWFASIPDVDAEAAKSFEAEVASNTELGSTPEERQKRLTIARLFARYATWVNMGLFAWAYIYPRPYQLMILVLAVIPWTAIVIMARSPGLYTLNAHRGSGRPDLTLLLISPGILLALRAFLDVHSLDWQRLLQCALIVAMLLMGSVIWALPAARERIGLLLLTLVLLIPYGYGVSALGNALLDHASASSYPTMVYRMFVTSGRSKTPTLRLGPWGPRATPEDTAVSWDLYRKTRVGETVCAQLHAGALGVRWFQITKCQPNS
jgi:hypothetical protein